MFENKHIVVGVCGGIAAYKAAGLVSHLRQAGADVHCIMTANAAKLVTPITFGELSGNDVTVDMFANIYKWDVEHIALARMADVFVNCTREEGVYGCRRSVWKGRCSLSEGKRRYGIWGTL